MKERFTILMIVALAVGVLASTVHADFILTLDDPTTATLPITVVDNGAGDLLPLDAGVIVFSGSIDNWLINVTTGLSKPVIGGATEAQLELNSVNVSTSGPGILEIQLTDTDFSLPAAVGAQGVLTSTFGGVAGGTIELTQILDPDNTEFAVLTPANDVVLQTGLLGPGAFASTLSTAAPVLGPFSLTEVVVITHGSGVTTTSFNAESTVVPVPAAFLLGLLGLGAAGLGLRRKVS